MNILTSYNWVKEYLDTDLSPQVFAQKTTQAGNGVEYIHDLAKRYEGMVIGEVVELKEHPNADKLRVAVTNIGDEKVEIVCGGENLEEEQLVVVALPGASVRWHGEGDWVELEETKIRGVESFGMICAAEEVGFEQLPQGEHDIWDVTDIVDATPGTPVAEALGLDDVMFDIEVTTNRPDAMSIVGQAREGGAATQESFTWQAPTLEGGNASAPEVRVDNEEICKKYEGVVIEGVEVNPSPWWLQKRLLLAGFKPVNNIVDITNYVLHEYGQPLHAFDADTLEGEIVVREAEDGEEIAMLDGETRELQEGMLVIADQDGPVAVAGVMGGSETGTSDDTTRIFLESATFDGTSVRRTSRDLQVRTNSSQLFEKHLSPKATRPAMARAVELILEIAGGEVVSGIFTHASSPYSAPTFPFDPADAPRLLGADIPASEALEMLERLGFDLENNDGTYTVTVPYWRDQDIEHKRDFIEEIARLYGYQNIPATLPSGALPERQKSPLLVWGRKAKEVLEGAGLLEAYSFSFVSEDELTQFGLNVDDAVALENPLSEDQAYMRPSLVPSLLSTVEKNEKRRSADAMFELANVYTPNTNGLPDHQLRLTKVMYGEDGYRTFRQLKGVLGRLTDALNVAGISLERPSEDKVPDMWVDKYHPNRSALVYANGTLLGILTEVAREVQTAFDIEARVTVLDLDFETLATFCNETTGYEPIPTYQDVRRDIAFVVDERTEVGDVRTAMKAEAKNLESIELFDIYRGEGVEAGEKSLAMHLSFRSQERTLSAEEVDEQLDAVREMLENRFDAILRS